MGSDENLQDKVDTTPVCSYQKCFTCHCSDCYTGMIAREKGEEEYNKWLQKMEEMYSIDIEKNEKEVLLL